MDNLKETMRDVLETNILSYWLTKVKDEENGGFYGRVDGNDQVHPVAEDVVLQNIPHRFFKIVHFSFFNSDY